MTRLFRFTHRIRWKRDLEIDVATTWWQEGGGYNSHQETRRAGEEEDVYIPWDDGHWPTVQMHLEEPRHLNISYDPEVGRMLIGVPRSDFEVVVTHSK